MENARVAIPVLRRRSGDETISLPAVACNSDTQHKKTRARGPKARTGCVTCKIRHVKCDERKPECQRCTSTGRKCDGYSNPPRKMAARKDQALVLKKPLPTTDEISPKELAALDFFQHCTAPALSTHFDVDFWTRLIFQMSYIEPCIRHAMAAVASLHQIRNRAAASVGSDWSFLICEIEDLSEPFASDSDDDEDPFAIAQYNRAIQQLSLRMDGSQQSVQVTIIACIMFVCIEYLRGDRFSSHKHLRAGMQVALSSLALPSTYTFAADSVATLQARILPMLNRIEVLSMLSGYQPAQAPVVDIMHAVPEHFTNMTEARDSLLAVANFAIRFIHDVRRRAWTGSFLPTDADTRTALLSTIETWRFAMDHMLDHNTFTSRQLEAGKVILLHQLVTFNWVQLSMHTTEIESDRYFPQFAHAVELAESIHKESMRTAQEKNIGSTAFIFDLEIVTPMFYIAKLCRHPLIRRRAIALLKQLHRREGLWDSYKAAALAERVMCIEEANLVCLDGTELPLEKDRIWHARSSSQVGVTAKRHRVVFSTRPQGVHGPWHSWTEVILLS